jgi:type I restriction enzyme R subunit
MNNYKYTEETVEKNLLKIFEEINFKYFDKNKIMEQRNNNISNVFLLKDIENSIKKINKKISNEHLKKMMYKIKILDSTNLIETNKIALDYLKNGIKIKDQKTNLTISYKLIDFKNKNNNLYKVTNQFLLSSLGSDYKKQIPDIVVYINGFPISVLELKTPRMNFNKSIQDAYEQIKNYQLNLSNLFTFNIFNCIYNGNAFKIGSLTSLIGRYNY